MSLTVLSLGGGVQSTTLALMAARGEIGPMPDAAIFADTKAEPAKVYLHMDWLIRQLPYPVFVVSKGNLKEEILAGMRGEGRIDARPPFFTIGGGMLRRQCTADYKIIPIQKKCRELLGLSPGQRSKPGQVLDQWIGISTDEAGRMKDSRVPYIRNRFPLIEMSMSRTDCLRWLAERGYPKPPKSACTFCPYHDNEQWRDLRDGDADAWAEAVAVDEAIRPGIPGPKRPAGEAWYLHADRIPLAQVDLSTASERGQINLFQNECEGMCGN